MLKRIKTAVPRPLARQVKIQRTRAFERLGSDRYTYPALNGLDRKMLTYLGHGEGVFLEIGANDGYSQSNTYHLERVRGWRGILVEPLPALYRTCRKIRPNSKCFNLACVGPGGPASVEIEDQDLMSVVLGLQDQEEEGTRLEGKRRVTVPAARLSDVIDLAGESDVDFMSIDVEGAELTVLAGLELDRHTPRYLPVETRHPDRVARLLHEWMTMADSLSHHDFLFSRD